MRTERDGKRVQVAIATVIYRGEGYDVEVLMTKRLDNGLYAFPGGSQEFREPMHLAAAREVLEETGLVVDIVTPCVDVQDHIDGDTHFVTLYHIAEYKGGEIVNTEPDKHGPWEWFKWYGGLPEPTWFQHKILRMRVPILEGF